MFSFTHVTYMVLLEVLWQIPQKEANQRKNWFKSRGWVFSPLQRAHLYLETSGWVSVGGCRSRAACSTSLLLWGVLEGDNSSWAALSYFCVPPVSCQAGMKQQVLQCYLSIPWGWKWGFLPKGGIYPSQLQLFAPQVPPMSLKPSCP